MTRFHRRVVGPLIALLFVGSSVPSPLYRVYQSRWHFADAVLTGVFAVYAVTVVVALLFLGPLSDRYGRRGLATAGLAVVEASMLVFRFAPDVGWLFVARGLQGMGVGVGGAALAAAIVDSSSDDSTVGALRANVWSNLGLGAGVLGAGLLVLYTTEATSIAFDALLGLFVVAIAVSATMPSRPIVQPIRPARGRTALESTTGRRREFLLQGVGLAVAWAVGGWYLSLGPSVAVAVIPSSGQWSGTLAVSSLGLVGAAVAGLGRRWGSVRQVRIGSPVLVVGLVAAVWASAARSDVTFVAGSIVLAAGWGLLAVGSFRALVGLSGPEDRAGVISVAYLISYGAFSIPAMAAGLAAGSYGLRGTTIVFGAIAGLAAAVAWGVDLRTVRPSASAAPLAPVVDSGEDR